MKKKGYFFTLDAMLSLGVLIIGSFLIFTNYVKIPSQVQTSTISQDVSAFFATTKIENLNNPYCGIGGKLWQEGHITNKDNTILQQFGEFYYKYRLNNDPTQLEFAEKCIVNTTDELIPLQFKSEFWIDDILIHPSDPTQQHKFSKGNTSILIPSKNMAYGILNNDLFGPYEFEVLVWQ